MNNSKMWLMVKPTVGIPLFLSAVAVGSFAVHVAVLSNTSWVADFLSGKPLGAGMASASLVLPEQDAATASCSASAGQEVLITMPNGTTAIAVLNCQRRWRRTNLLRPVPGAVDEGVRPPVLRPEGLPLQFPRRELVSPRMFEPSGWRWPAAVSQPERSRVS